ncbi:Hypothetical protein I595_3162 [Croceitalea dokdonensis DOKDO 023]|uniref:PKD domain-containing protein n=1 Tax=Croceitalea dokdonensis DOKDO 023 TaxID=1300341 RepID=A0A0P7AS48_9FLAO|nr:hypothetical protein [Croceitalea dokdonensis]KPM30666.1 Hypothetical protein I595_3162 [Croceitalea dokdonensis DOKDO 023]
MRLIKNLLVGVLVATALVACKDDDNTSFVLQEISAPTNVNAIFDIAQDDSGEVSVTPTAVGASVFEVFFGDVENETPTEVAPGETITKVYGEGEFILKVVAIGATGLTSELSRVVTISFTPPTDLQFALEISDENPFEVIVSASAQNATVYDVFFGATEDEVPVTIMNGETAQFTYAEIGDYVVRVVARGAGAATIEASETVTILGNADPIVLPITFDSASVNYAFGTFNGASYEIVENPDASGANPTVSNVGAITNSGAQFEGGAFNLGTPVDFSGNMKTITMKMWSQVAVPVLLKFEGGVNDERQTEVVANHSGTGWEDLSFNFATDAIKSFIDGNQGVGEPFVPEGQYATMVIFIDGPGTTAGTFFIDDIAQTASEDTNGGNDETSPNVDDSSATQVALPVGFESTTLTYSFVGFEGADSAIEANPVTDGINPTSTAMRSTKTVGAQFFAGTFLDLESPIDFASTQTISIKTLSPKVGIPIRMALENSAGGVDQIVVDVNTTVANAWEELRFDFSGVFNSGAQYNRMVIFFEFVPDLAGDGSTYYYDDIQILGSSGDNGGTSGASGNVDDSAATQVALPVGFESTSLTYSFVGFEGADSAIEANPDASGINPTATIMRTTKTAGAQFFAGTFLDLEAPIDFSSTQKVSMKTWSPKANIPVRVALENAAGGVDQIVVDVNTTTANGWEELVFDFSGVFNAGAEYNRIVVFFEFVPDLAGDGSTYYYDDIQLIN